MQAAIDDSIAAHAEPETLYDKPEIDKSRLRITGPFTVEAVPAPTVLALDETDAAERGRRVRRPLRRDLAPIARGATN